MSGVIFGGRTAARVKKKVYKMIVRTAMMYVGEALTKRWAGVEMDISEGQLRSSVMETKLEASLRWFGHVDGRDSGYAGQRALHIKLPGRRKSERLKRRFMDVVTCRGLV